MFNFLWMVSRVPKLWAFFKRPNRMFQLNEPETLTEINLRGKGVQKTKVYSHVPKCILNETWSLSPLTNIRLGILCKSYDQNTFSQTYSIFLYVFICFPSQSPKLQILRANITFSQRVLNAVFASFMKMKYFDMGKPMMLCKKTEISTRRQIKFSSKNYNR